MISGLSLFWTIDRAKRSEGRLGCVPQPSALSTVAGVGARVAPQRCPILRTSNAILPFWAGGAVFRRESGRLFDVNC